MKQINWQKVIAGKLTEFMSRLFFALWPDEKTRKQISNVTSQLEHQHLKLVKNSNLHITLEFLGEVSDQDRDALIDKAGRLHCKIFNLELTQAGWWRRPQVLWIGTSHIPTALFELVESIRQCVRQQGLKTDNREYKPHMTLARKVKKKIHFNETFHIPWHVDQFVLVESKTFESGVEYRVVREWSLN